MGGSHLFNIADADAGGKAAAATGLGHVLCNVVALAVVQEAIGGGVAAGIVGVSMPVAGRR